MPATAMPAPLLPPGAAPATLAPPPVPSPPLASVLPPPEPGALGPALRRALGAAAGRVVLRVEEAAPHRRRVARALLQEGALAAGGQVLEGPGGDLLLVGAEAGRAERLRILLERLVGPAGTLVWSLERDAEALLAYAAGRGPAAPRPPETGPDLAGLDAFLDALPLAQAVRRRHGMMLAGDGPPRPAFLRLEPGREALAALLGRLARDADLLDHALRRIGGRLAAALADPKEARALLGPALPPRLHLPLPVGMGSAGPKAPPGLLVATVPLADAAEPAALAARRAALAGAGIALELDGLDAAALGLLDPAMLPVDLIRLRWSPELAGPGPMGVLRGLDPARLVLAGEGPAALGAARSLGIRLVEPA